MTQCSICGGSGVIPIDDTRVRQCRCAHIKKMRSHLGSEIATAPVIRESPLYKLTDGVVSEDLTTKNLFIESSWNALLPHLKFAFIHKGLTFYFRVITDEKIKNVFVGNENYKVKTERQRELEGFYNGLPDLVGEVVDLLILRFGFLGYPNRSISGATKEALLIRESLSLPTWLVSHPNQPFEETYTYGPELGVYVDTHFTKVSIDSTKHPDEDMENTEGMSVDTADDPEPPTEENEAVPDSVPEPAPKFEREESGSLELDSVLGGGDDRKYRKKSRR